MLWEGAACDVRETDERGERELWEGTAWLLYMYM